MTLRSKGPRFLTDATLNMRTERYPRCLHWPELAADWWHDSGLVTRLDLTDGPTRDVQHAQRLAVGLALRADMIEDERIRLAEADIEWRRDEAARTGRMAAEDRAQLWLDRADHHVSGGAGSAQLLRVVATVVRGFALGERALPMLLAWDAARKPRWGEREIKRAVRSTMRKDESGWML